MRKVKQSYLPINIGMLGDVPIIHYLADTKCIEMVLDMETNRVIGVRLTKEYQELLTSLGYQKVN